MSRIGRKPIPVPAGVKVQLSPAAVEVQGPKGKMNVPVPRGIRFEQKDGVLTALRDTEEHRALHGLARALVANAVRGVTEGFKKDLDIVGVGYRAELKGKTVVFRSRLFAPDRVSRSRGHSDHRREADAFVRQRRGPRQGRAGRRQYPRVAPAGSLQAKGHPAVGRAAQEEGGQSGRGQDRSVKREGEGSWPTNRFASCRATRIGSGCTSAFAAASRARPRARGCASIARSAIFTRR